MSVSEGKAHIASSTVMSASDPSGHPLASIEMPKTVTTRDIRSLSEQSARRLDSCRRHRRMEELVE